MTAAHTQKLKTIALGLGSPATQFECQVSSWTLENNTEDGDKFFTFCPDGEGREEADPDYALSLTFFADWRSEGISEYLVLHDGETVEFLLDHHPDIAEENVQWSGSVKIKAPNVGGDARTTETQEITLPIIGKPEFTRVVTP